MIASWGGQDEAVRPLLDIAADVEAVDRVATMPRSAAGSSSLTAFYLLLR